MNLADDLKKQIVRERRHGRPVLDVRAELKLCGRIRLTFAVEHAVPVDPVVKEILRFRIITGKVFG